MERLSDLGIILKNFPYQERDRIAVVFTENYGIVTGLAKGGIYSRRFAGSLDFLSCSKIGFIQKPNAELARIDDAHIHYEFSGIQKDFEILTAASFAAEFCLRILQPKAVSREMFLVLSNMLFQLNAGMFIPLAVNAFLCKSFRALGYPPSLLRCVQCARGAHEIAHSRFFWASEFGGMVCETCSEGRFKKELSNEVLLYFQKLTTTPFKELSSEKTDLEQPLYQVLSDFLHRHVPEVPSQGFKSWKLLNEVLHL